MRDTHVVLNIGQYDLHVRFYRPKFMPLILNGVVIQMVFAAELIDKIRGSEFKSERYDLEVLSLFLVLFSSKNLENTQGKD